MEYALSQKDGREYYAVSVDYDKAKKLDMICPVCSGKVFKRVRWIPDENHCFVHHKGGSLDCDLYHAGDGSLSNAAFEAMSRGQEFQQFIRQFETSVQELLVKTHVFTKPDTKLIGPLSLLTSSLKFPLDSESFEYVEEVAITHLGDVGLIENARVSRILDAKLRFYRHPQARFIDGTITAWIILGIKKRYPESDIGKLVEVMTTNTVDLENAAGLFFAGLSAKDAGSGLSWFKWIFDQLQLSQCRQIPKSILGKIDPKFQSDKPRKQDAVVTTKFETSKNTAAPQSPQKPPAPAALVNDHYLALKQKLIEVGYRFQPFGLGMMEVAVAPNGTQKRIYTSFDLDDLLDECGNKGANNSSQKTSPQKTMTGVTEQPRPSTQATPGIKSSLNPAAAWPFPTGSRPYKS